MEVIERTVQFLETFTDAKRDEPDFSDDIVDLEGNLTEIMYHIGLKRSKRSPSTRCLDVGKAGLKSIRRLWGKCSRIVHSNGTVDDIGDDDIREVLKHLPGGATNSQTSDAASPRRADDYTSQSSWADVTPSEAYIREQARKQRLRDARKIEQARVTGNVRREKMEWPFTSDRFHEQTSYRDPSKGELEVSINDLGTTISEYPLEQGFPDNMDLDTLQDFSDDMDLDTITSGSPLLRHDNKNSNSMSLAAYGLGMPDLFGELEHGVDNSGNWNAPNHLTSGPAIN